MQIAARNVEEVTRIQGNFHPGISRTFTHVCDVWSIEKWKPDRRIVNPPPLRSVSLEHEHVMGVVVCPETPLIRGGEINVDLYAHAQFGSNRLTKSLQGRPVFVQE